MVFGADIRRYRQTIGLNQRAFAERLGIAQPTLSQIEAGRISVSDEYLARLTQRFAEPEFRTSFSAFLKHLRQERAGTQAALTAPHGRYLTLAVWRWQEGFDLSQVPAPEQAVNLVTVRATEKPLIAFEMPKEHERWNKDEILIFERIEMEDLQDGDLCLVQVRRSRARSTQTAIALARLLRATKGHTLHFEPISPAGAGWSAENKPPEAVLRLSWSITETRKGRLR